MPIDVNAMLLRLTAIEKAGLLALSTPVTSDAVPRFFHTQEAFPYWTNRLSGFTTEAGEDNYGEGIEVYTYDVTARCVLGHTTGGYNGEYEEALQVYFPHMVEYIDARELLQSVDYPAALLHIRRARVSGGTPFAIFSGVLNVSQVGFEIVIRAEFDKEITQAYL